MSAGPHTASVLATLQAMRDRYAAMPEPTCGEDLFSRQITLALHEAVMPVVAAMRDAGGGQAGDEIVAQGITHAMGNLLASLASCFTDGGPDVMVRQAHMLGKAVSHRAMLRVMDPSRGVVVWHGEPAPHREGTA